MVVFGPLAKSPSEELLKELKDLPPDERGQWRLVGSAPLGFY